MKFTLPQRDFAQMLKAVINAPGLPKNQRDQHLRIEASKGILKVNANEAEASVPVNVTTEGVCFLNYSRLLPLIQTFRGKGDLTVEVTTEGLQIGTFRVSNEIWYSLFDKPAKAPARMIGQPEPNQNKNSVIQNWRAKYGKSNTDPQGRLFD